ncbi:hypothetical protein AB5J49_43070 [Streptomyces sp. R28]|uniref:Uncharacterized protein n=1 Tax=Streptomyces sp. R28 TaxID=3238628 RepID=A0AB39QAR0_9ACTN
MQWVVACLVEEFEVVTRVRIWSCISSRLVTGKNLSCLVCPMRGNPVVSKAVTAEIGVPLKLTDGTYDVWGGLDGQIFMKKGSVSGARVFVGIRLSLRGWRARRAA